MYGPYNITFPAGVTRTLFNVSIIDDDVYEVNETFELVINSLFLPVNVSVVNPNQTTVIIKNDDCKWCDKLYFVMKLDFVFVMHSSISNISNFIMTLLTNCELISSK